MYIQVTLLYRGKQYWLIDRFDWPEFELARFQWEENNYACDCNRSLFLQRQCDGRIPELPCGGTIELLSLTPIEKKQRPISTRRMRMARRKMLAEIANMSQEAGEY